jgi:glutamine amidotransferase
MEPSAIKMADRVILSGVGAFDAGVEALSRYGWVGPLTQLAREAKVPILGICLGMQLMCRRSAEGILPGLGWFEADVRRLVPEEKTLKVPHMGWNTILFKKSDPIIPSLSMEQRFYFVHSYHVVCDEPQDVLATTSYGGEITAAISRNRLYGTQFHPEKSHRFGMELIKAFCRGFGIMGTSA